ncbi:hypothetical protein DFH06DRAFT_1223300 [Mycena polygramma]|nr:hypothetical protein DFH06DRAFT_1223300 [Mycena polygramma]
MSRHPQTANAGDPSFVHYRHPPPYYHQQNGYVPVHHPPQPDATELLFQRFSQTTLDLSRSQQAHTDAWMHRIESEITSARRESQESVVQIAEVLQKSHLMHLARIKRIENILGMGPEMKDQKTLLERFDLLSFAVEEIVERLKDPEANLPDPLHHDMATSPFRRAYADVAIPPKTPTPKPRLSSIAVGPSPNSDVFSEAQKDPESNVPDGPLHYDMATSPFHRAYADVAIPPKTPTPKPRLSSMAVGPSPNSDVFLEDQTMVADESIYNKVGGFFGDIVSRSIHKPSLAAASPVSPVARSLVPADWHEQDSVEQSPSPQRILALNPTITSLRQETLGDRFAGPSMSTPYRSTSVHPVSPALPGSPSESPRVTPRPVDSAFDDDSRVRSPTPEPVQVARESSVGVHDLSSKNAGLSRSPTMEPNNDVLFQSPSADTLREELSVLDMMSPSQSDASPARLPLADEPSVPSSVTPSPMLRPKDPESSPPRLTLSIPNPPAVSRPVSTPPDQDPAYPGPADLFDSFMSPLSPSTPSEMPDSPAASPSPLSSVSLVLKREAMITDISAPPSAQASSSRPTVSVLRPYPPGVNATSASAPPAKAKKRKAKQEVPEAEFPDEPPSKRARPASSGKPEKGKRKKKAEAVVWPEMTPQAAVVPEFVGKFVGCDKKKCERWYHYSCLGIVPGDPRLEGTFHCPLCVAGHPPPPSTQDSTAAEECSRPECPVQERFYEATGVFGRYTKLHSTHGRVYYWLVFWKGYNWYEATWEPEPPSDEAVEEFNRRAAEEGIDLDDDSVSYVMLAEAVEGGARQPEAEAQP